MDTRRPHIALILPPNIAAMMFLPADLDRLRAAATVSGPVDCANRSAVKSLLAAADIAITGWGSPRFDADLLSAAPNLRLIARSAGSVKGIVTDALYERGIRVTTAAAPNAIPVAHCTVAMIVAALKQVFWLAPAMRANDDAAIKARWPQIRELQHMTVGLVGASRVGREVIKLLKHYPGVTIRLHDPHVTPAQAADLGVELSSLDDVRRRPLYVVLDVTDPEPPPRDSPLRAEPNIILTPHIAGAMKQARWDMGRLAIDETLRHLSAQPLQHEVTRQMLATQA